MSFSVVPYSAAWPTDYEACDAELRAVFAHSGEIAIEHIGSTSVTGLCAKPIIDVLLGVRSLEVVELAIPMLLHIGFNYIPEHEIELPERRYFVRPADHRPRVNIHAVERSGRLWQRHIAFRDLLRGNPELAGDYGRLKFQLAQVHAHDLAAYTAAKAPFIEAQLATVFGAA